MTTEERYVCTNEVTSCSHEETNTGIVIHARHGAGRGSRITMVKKSNTDILLIAVTVLLVLWRSVCSSSKLLLPSGFQQELGEGDEARAQDGRTIK